MYFAGIGKVGKAEALLNPDNVQHCPFCISQFHKSLMIDGRCPNCHIELVAPKHRELTESRGGDIISGDILSVNGICKSMDFVTKCKKIIEKEAKDLIGAEIGHGYCVFEFKWDVDINRLEEHLRKYLMNIYEGWDVQRSEKFLCVIDKEYDVKQPDKRLPTVDLPAAKPSDGEDDATVVAPNESEEANDN